MPGVARGTAVDFTWTEPAANGSAITGCVVQWKSGAQSYHTSRQVGSNTGSVSVTGLTPNTAYTFRLRCTNGIGAGPWTDEIVVTPTALRPRGPVRLGGPRQGGSDPHILDRPRGQRGRHHRLQGAVAAEQRGVQLDAAEDRIDHLDHHYEPQ